MGNSPVYNWDLLGAQIACDVYALEKLKPSLTKRSKFIVFTCVLPNEKIVPTVMIVCYINKNIRF